MCQLLLLLPTFPMDWFRVHHERNFTMNVCHLQHHQDTYLYFLMLQCMLFMSCRVIALLLLHKARTGDYIPYWTQRITKVVFLIYGENKPVTISFKLSLLEYNRIICESVPLTVLTYVFYIEVLWVMPLGKQADMLSSSCFICVKHIWKSKSIRIVEMQM